MDDHKYCKICGQTGLVEDMIMYHDINTGKPVMERVFKCDRMFYPHIESLDFEEITKGA